MRYLKIVNIVLKRYTIILKEIVWETQNGIKISVGQVVLKLLMKT